MNKIDCHGYRLCLIHTAINVINDTCCRVREQKIQIDSDRQTNKQENTK